MISLLRRPPLSHNSPRTISYTGILLLLTIILIMISLVAATQGAVQIPLVKLLSAKLDNFELSVLFNIRLPRILLAIIVGAALGVSGAAMQGLFRNPLADPTLIGITGGAAVCVATVIVFAGQLISFMGLYTMSFAAFAGGIVTSLIILRLARISGVFSVTHMLLAGIAINALTFAGTGLMSFLSTDQQLREISFWTMGSLGGALWTPVLVTATLVLPCVFLLSSKAKELNVLLLGEENATYTGIDVNRLKRIVVICAALCVGAAVSVSGIIGFVGLVVPHLIRLMLGADNRLLMPASALFGGALLLLADTIARTALSPTEMPVGIITSLVGGPFFIWLLIRHSKGQV
ncbi:FecCD family ABC transporter permease [Sneathiella glossodoripedis]|uniref:FecCD family ABC transporter permease n=1 Tax=Sneathiella glossodoripedis TaxID=418853 RepID=UPI001900A563|nr:iron ABC transporter permease [Sneathiella glossodoripedis]